MNFGVGGQQAKRLGTQLESALLELLRKAGFHILLNYGAGEAETPIVGRLVAASSGSAAHLTKAQDWKDGAGIRRVRRKELITIRGTFRAFAGSVQIANVFIGYDSAPAQVAAAMRVPVIEVSAGAPNEVYRKRRTSYGVGSVCVIPAEGPEDAGRVLVRIDRELGEIKAEWNRVRQPL